MVLAEVTQFLLRWVVLCHGATMKDSVLSDGRAADLTYAQHTSTQQANFHW